MGRLLSSLWYRQKETLPAKILLAPLSLLAALFGLGASLRRAFLGGRGYRPKAKVISVGNLTVGGAGKTPVVIALAQRLSRRGRRVAVLSRGYGRKTTAPVVVSDGVSVLADASQGGDEPLLIARSCSGVPVLVGSDRAALARTAEEKFGAEVLLLDDGFQHLKLARDLDVVVVDASNPFGNGHLLPRGPLREGPQALGRAGLVWLSRCDQAEPSQVTSLEACARDATGREVVRSAYRVRDIADGSLRDARPASSLRDVAVLLLAGVARPESFRKTLEALGARIVGERVFEDHHAFTAAELDDVRAEAQRLNASRIALTEKDAVRLPPLADPERFAVVRVEVEILSGESALEGALPA